MSDTAAKAITLVEMHFSSLVESRSNPRRHWDQAKLEELASSIREKGVIEPIIVRPIEHELFEIVAGHRRARAAKLAGQSTIPAIVRALTDTQALELAVIENGQREDVHPLDEALGYEALMDLDRAYSVAVVAAKVGKTESYIYRRLKLLQLIPPVQKAFEADALTVAHAERLARLTPELQQRAYDDVLFLPMFRVGPGADDDQAGENIPSRDALEPLSHLDDFIRQHTAVEVDSEDTKHYFPELEEQIQEAVESDTTGAGASEAGNTLLKLSASFHPRQQLGLERAKDAPLPAARWHEIESKKDVCPNVVAGVIVHGGPLRVVNVCAKKGCPKHFPVAKKDERTTGTKSSGPTWEQQQEQRQKEAAEWKAVYDAAAPALVKHLGKLKFNAALVRAVMDTYDINRVENTFHVKLTDKTAAMVLALNTVRGYSRSEFLRSVKPMKFNLGPVESKLKAEAKLAAKKAAKASKG